MNDPILGHILYQSHSQSEAETAYDELLAYVDELERIAAEGTAGGDIPFSARSIKPKWLQGDSESLDPNQEKE